MFLIKSLLSVLSLIKCGFYLGSGHVEECYLSMPDHMSSSLVELKRIPNSAALVLGHNGFGEFGLWYAASSLCQKQFNFLIRFCSPQNFNIKQYIFF